MRKLLYLLFPLMFAMPIKAQSNEIKVIGGAELKLQSNYLVRGFKFNEGATGILKGNVNIENGKNSLYFMALQSNNLEREVDEPSNIEHTLLLEGKHEFDKNTSVSLGAVQTWLYGAGVPYVNEVYVAGNIGPVTLTAVKGLMNLGGWYGSAEVTKEAEFFGLKPEVSAKVGIMHNYFENHSGPQDLTVKLKVPVVDTENIDITAFAGYQYSMFDSENTDVSAGISVKFFD